MPDIKYTLIADVLKQQLQIITCGHDINFLINNAGIGGTSSITHTSLERIDDIIMLNVRGTVLLILMLLLAVKGFLNSKTGSKGKAKAPQDDHLRR